MKKSNLNEIDEMPSDIDFSTGLRGKYAVHFPKGSRLILLDSNVVEAFPDQQAANSVLRGLAEINKGAKRANSKTRGFRDGDHK